MKQDKIIAEFLKWWLDECFPISPRDKKYATDLSAFYAAKGYLSEKQTKIGRKLGFRLTQSTPIETVLGKKLSP